MVSLGRSVHVNVCMCMGRYRMLVEVVARALFFRYHHHKHEQTDKHKLVTHNLGDISKVRRSVHVLLLRVMHTTSYLTYITKIKSDRFICLCWEVYIYVNVPGINTVMHPLT